MDIPVYGSFFSLSYEIITDDDVDFFVPFRITVKLKYFAGRRMFYKMNYVFNLN